LLAILFTVMTVQACTQAPLPETTATGAITSGSAGSPDPHTSFRDTCDREHMNQCESACTIPGGILDLYCYEDCIYSIC
jgi:hypothetical protein